MEKDFKEVKKGKTWITGGESGPGRKNSQCKGPEARTRV